MDFQNGKQLIDNEVHDRMYPHLYRKIEQLTKQAQQKREEKALVEMFGKIEETENDIT